MPDHKTFARVAIEQAAANAVRVDLVLDAVTPHTDTRLISRALGLCPDGLALATPASADGRKVYLPADWELGLSFEIGGLWFQARTVILRHTFFDCGRGRRADALIVQSPNQLTSCNRRRSVRHRVPASQRTPIRLWPAPTGPAEPAPPADALAGVLVDFSAGGLGLELWAEPNLERGCEILVQLRLGGADDVLLRAMVKHCTPLPDRWHVGLGDVAELDGTAIDVAEHPAVTGRRSGGRRRPSIPRVASGASVARRPNRA